MNNPTERLTKVAVLGAAGKMGSGITLLAALEMARLSLLPENRGKSFTLHAIDVSPKALNGLMDYLKAQVLRQAERQIVTLRKVYADRENLVENFDFVQQYVWDVLQLVVTGTRLEGAFDAGCVFEAVSENPELKVSLMKTIHEGSREAPWFFTNTSSIPIAELDRQAGLNGNIVGLHFYNPPAVQKLVEIAAGKKTRPELTEMAHHLAKAFGKKVAISADVPGFIGNGHFMRDLIFGIAQAEILGEEMPLTHGIYIVNTVTQDYLLRPMGIFQLIDYVGIDVCRHILEVMAPHFPKETLHSKLLDNMFERGILGGQHSDGSQKPGFFTYGKGSPTDVYDLTKNEYAPLEPIHKNCRQDLGPLPASHIPWKALIAHPEKESILKAYFDELKKLESPAALLALSYLERSRDIAHQLVEEGVVDSPEVVNLVLKTGFFHPYGPVNDYI
jgi:3-hydroxyacyl-CoA dehydrogenase